MTLRFKQADTLYRSAHITPMVTTNQKSMTDIIINRKEQGILLELKNKLNNVVGCKINIQKSVVFLYINSKRESKDQSP